MQPSLRALRYFLAVADTGSITTAARRLHVSQPSVSGTIARLESELGVQLLVRHHAKGVTLTAAGRRLTNDARVLLRHAADFAQNALALGHELKGEVTVGCFLTLAPVFMPTLMAGFARSHPGITITLHEGDQQSILEGLSTGRLEMALSYHYALPEEVAAEPLLELPPRLFVSTDHPLAKARAASLAEVIEEPFILLDLPLSRDYFFGLFSALGLSPRVAFRTRSYELVRGLVGRGLGYAVLNTIPQSPVAYDGSRVATVAIRETLQPVRIVSLQQRRHAARPAVAAFAAFVRDAFAPGGPLAGPSVSAGAVDLIEER